jgi:hypothetical protein
MDRKLLLIVWNLGQLHLRLRIQVELSISLSYTINVCLLLTLDNNPRFLLWKAELPMESYPVPNSELLTHYELPFPAVSLLEESVRVNDFETVLR